MAKGEEEGGGGAGGGGGRELRADARRGVCWGVVRGGGVRPAANHSGGPGLQALQLDMDTAALELMNIERRCRSASSSGSWGARGGG